MDKLAAEKKPSNTNVSMRAPFFYRSSNAASVQLALEVPSESITLTREQGKAKATVDFLGIATAPDGTVAARFSDTVNIYLENEREVDEFRSRPFHYEKHFEVPSGRYLLKVVFSSGKDRFGVLEEPLSIDSYSGDEFGISAIALSTQTRNITDASESLERELLEDRFALISRGVQFVPSGTNQFQKTDSAFLYVEIYEPLLTRPNPPKVAVQYVVVDRNTKEMKLNTGLIEVNTLIEPGNPVIAAGLKLPVGSLPAGSYRLEVRASDTSGRSRIRAADFEVR